MSGIGETLFGLTEFPEFSILLVNSKIEVSTKSVFTRLMIDGNSPELDDPLNSMSARELFTKLAALQNDLEPPALEIAPEIATVLGVINEQEGCHLTRMSGSGATCFGLFEKSEAAQTAAKAIQSYYPDWWVQAADVRT
jgi:4-diphosphocytidyl-2-C-methyl-D-erythritol kinase